MEDNCEKFCMLSNSYNELLKLMESGTSLIDNALMLETDFNKESIWEEVYFKIFSPVYAYKIEREIVSLKNYRPEGDFKNSVLNYWRVFGAIMKDVQIIYQEYNFPF